HEMVLRKHNEVQCLTNSCITMNNDNESPLDSLSFRFAVAIRALCLSKMAHSNGDKNSLIQLYRSGTSVGANIRESRYAESKKDLLHKLKIAEKELGECSFWLQVLSCEPRLLNPVDTNEVNELGRNLKRVLRRAILTLKKQNL
ncbi:MAG: four helix bundle protein, partial [Ignavibacteria bacterium]